MTRSPDLAELIRDALEYRLQRLHVCMPGRVQSYDAATQTADVLPMLQAATVFDDSEIAESLPVIPSVPVAFPRTANAFLSFPVAAGDFVTLVFSERSLDRFRDLGGAGSPVDPVDLRMHDLSDAIATPGMFPDTAPLDFAHPQNIVMGFNGQTDTRTHWKPGGQVALTGENPADMVALASKVIAQFTALKTALTAVTLSPAADPTTTTAAVAAFQTALGVLFGTGWPLPVASAKVQSD